MVATKQSRIEPNPTSRLGAVSHARPSRLDSPPLKTAGERTVRHGSGYTTPTTPISHDSSSFIDGRPKTAAEKQREKRLRDDPLADLLSPLFVGCRRCGTRIKLSPKSSYDPFHWIKHRERCLRRSVVTVKETLREKDDQTSSLGVKSTHQGRDVAIVDIKLAAPSRVVWPLSSPSLPSPSVPRLGDMDSGTPSLTADDDEVDKSSYSDQRSLPSGEEEGVLCESDTPPRNASEATPPLCSLSVFRTSDMLAFEDYLHRSRRLPTRLGFPELLPSPEKWHDWSWGQLRAPVYVVAKRPKGIPVTVGVDQPLSSDDDTRNAIL
ncbi:hypothetical protein B0F90DRAFT_936285 [Multifurca ochricompacta]|uniref:Uncharacterized protein n=1 Tax=Multifurca ochricompacta TaxID=376703 RepID=A0AAD4M8Q9_9AGAM|nr:hypothetical protein B0F90DRAFT_936285 [Multifurca ochricompacta]